MIFESAANAVAEASCVITEGARVTLHFSLALRSGDMIDSNFSSSPASFQLGDGSMLPGFEAHLLGCSAGSRVKVIIPTEQAFGAFNPANIHRIPRARFMLFLDDEYETLEPGTVVSFKDPAGFDLPAVVREKTDTLVTVDFNHPLAGKDIEFEAHIIAVLPAGSSNLEVRL